MNSFIKDQCKNMITTVAVFEQACEMSAKKDDGTISKEEEKALKHIRKAAKAFKAELARYQ